VKGIVSSIGWILLLILAAVFLLFYNFAYIPRADRIVRQKNEIAMWTDQVQELSDSLQLVKRQNDTAFHATFTFDELFGGADPFTITPQGESALRAYVPTIQGLPGRIEVIGHGDKTGVPARLKQQYPSNWEYAAARAGAVARALIGWGVMPERIWVLSAGDLRPPVDSSGLVGSVPKRRVEIIVRNQ
jgi:flagellar motor protein MotB